MAANDFTVLSKAVETGDDKKVVELVKQELAKGTSPIDIMEKGLVPGVQALGQLFKDGQVYLPEILISVRAMDRGMELLKPLLKGKDIHNKGTVVLGSVEGDLHDIGKNLVKMMLESNGFKVVDVGVDVPATTFAKAAKDNNANIVAMSSLLTITMPEMPKVIEALKAAGLKGKVKCIVGGAPVTREYANSIGCEGFAEDCASAVDEASRLMAA
ncbi:MAG: corrinoid protein [Dehalococcoidales bacterium]|nr:corrinoid protein [Dehalococcoidales bacterium]